MSVAWTTIAILGLLLPGIFFFIGLATYERLSREIIRSGVVSEIALAIIVAIVLHTIAVSTLSAFGFRLSAYLAPLAEYSVAAPAVTVQRISERLVSTVAYLLITTGLGFGLGCLAAWGIVTGWLRFLAHHKWIYDVVDAGRKGKIITAYVMTNIIEDSRVLMYRGRVHEIFLSNEGTISYVILKNCAKFYILFGPEGLTTSKQYKLFEEQDEERIWDYLFIEGTNISNILFDPSPKGVRQTGEGERALKEELLKRRQIQIDRIRRLREARQQTRNTPPQSN
jgi:hypothetical protein